MGINHLTFFRGRCINLLLELLDSFCILNSPLPLAGYHIDVISRSVIASVATTIVATTSTVIAASTVSVVGIN